MQRIIVFINGIIAVATLLSYLAGYVNPQTIGVLPIFGLLYPLLFIINLFFVLFWLLANPKYITISILVLLLGFNHVPRHVGIKSPSSTEKSKKALNIFSMNINLGTKLHDKNQSKQKEKQDKFLKHTDIMNMDIICLQEAHRFPKDLFASWFPDWETTAKLGVIDIIYSKYPIIDRGEIKLKFAGFYCTWADIKAPSQTIRVYSVHLHSNKVTSQTKKILNQNGLEDKDAWSDIKYIFSSYNQASKIRVEEFKLIRDHYLKSPYPVILCGDLNDTPESYVYHQITKDLNDTFCESGSGLGYSYAGKIPMLRIDYMFVDKSLKVSKNHVLHRKYSDHFPIISTIEIAN